MRENRICLLLEKKTFNMSGNSSKNPGLNDDSFKSISSGSSALDKIRHLFQLRRNSVDVDVHLMCNSRRLAEAEDQQQQDIKIDVPGHKIFLRICPYFSRLLDAAPPQQQTGQILKIEIDLDPEILEEMLRYIYTGEIEINAKNWVQLFQASNKLQLNDKELLARFTKFQIGPLLNEANWLDLLRIFNLPGSGRGGGKFLKEIFQFLREKSSEFMNWPLFLQLTFDEIRLILNAESRIFKNAKDFQTSLLKWMSHDSTSKAHLIEQLGAFNFIELPEIIDLSEPSAEEDKISKLNNDNLTELVNDFTRDNDQNQNQNDNNKDSNCGNVESVDLSDLRKRKRGRTVQSTGSKNSKSISSSLATLKKRSRVNLNYTPLPRPLGPLKSSNQSILFSDGYDLYNYTFHNNICHKLCDFPTLNLHGFSMVFANDRLYIMGGKNRNTPSQSFALSSKVVSCPRAGLLQETNQKVIWKNELDFKEMAHFSTIFLNNRIYTIGGIYNDKEKDIFHKPLCYSFESYFSLGDIRELVWSMAFTCTLYRSQCAVALLNHELYITGGIGLYGDLPERANLWGKGSERLKHGFEDIAIDSVEVFNNINKTVVSVANLRLARFDHQALAFQNKIFVLGGKVMKSGIDPEKAAFVMDDKIFVLGGNGGEKPTMEVYNPSKNKWKLVRCGDFPKRSNFSNFLLMK